MNTRETPSIEIGHAIVILIAAVSCWSLPDAAFAAPTVAQLAEDVGLSAEDLARVEKAEMVETTPKDRADRELSMGMVFLVRAPLEEVVEGFQQGRDLEHDPRVQDHGQFRGSDAIADLSDLKLLTRGTEEARRYVTASPGQVLNLSTEEIASFRTLGGAEQPKVEALLRQVLSARYRAYRANGLDGIVPYDRGGGVQLEPADELRRHSAAKILGNYSPAFREVLNRYPAVRPEGLDEHFFWIVYDLDDRPTISLRHRMRLPMGDGFVLADREYYVSQGYNAMQAHIGFLPSKQGTMVFYVTRTSTDRVSGFGSTAKHSIGRNLMTRDLQAIFDRMRAAFEKR
ncbi:hypothetical protein K2X89_17655 [Myxococcota bacterium]|nr:hypothetical protein [Myxococcota bacterium]